MDERPPREPEQLAPRVAEHPAELVVHLGAGPVGCQDRRTDERQVEIRPEPGLALRECRAELELATQVACEARRPEHAERHRHGEVRSAGAPRQRVGRRRRQVQRIRGERPDARERLISTSPREDHRRRGDESGEHPHARRQRRADDGVVRVERDAHHVHEAHEHRQRPCRAPSQRFPGHRDQREEADGEGRHPAPAIREVDHLEQCAQRETPEKNAEP